MHHVMFDIDDTLVRSMQVDSALFAAAIESETQQTVCTQWVSYQHVTDDGIVQEILQACLPETERESAKTRIKQRFLRDVDSHLDKHPLPEIPGARVFLQALLQRTDIIVSLATGGWRQSAIRKLRSANLWFPDIPLASSDDAISRTQIMLTALNKSGRKPDESVTYFGDGIWDKQACEALGFNFVLIGQGVEHQQRLQDYSEQELAMEFIFNGKR